MMKKLLAAVAASLLLANSHAATLKTAQGEVEIAKTPERIAVYDIGALDTLIALGLGEKIVGIPGEKFAADFATPNAKEIGTLFEPDLEALNAVKPDLIIVASRSASKLDEVQKVAQAVDLSIPGENAYQEGLARLNDLGALFAKEAEAKKISDELNALRDEVKTRAAGKGKVLALLVNGPKIALYGPDSRAGWLQSELGLQLVHNEKMSGRHGDPVSFEYIAQENPDWIYALDRLAAIGEDGASARQTLDKELVHGKKAWKKGCTYDSWTEFFNYDKWIECFHECNIDPDLYANRHRNEFEQEPWDHIDCGVTKDYLRKEWKMAQKGLLTHDCRHLPCNGCAVCPLLDVKLIDHKEDVPGEKAVFIYKQG